MNRLAHLPAPLLIAATLGLTACDNAVRNYVRDANPPTTRGPASEAQGPQQISISPGSVDSTAANLRMKARAATTDRNLRMGADRSAVISIGRTRESY